MIPQFEADGFLPEGVHTATGNQLIMHFCNGPHRKGLEKPVIDILDFASAKGAIQVLFGGSFVTSASSPGDIDCVVVFGEENQIPDYTDRLIVSSTQLGIFYCSTDQPNLVSAFLRLFSENKKARKVGVVAVQLRGDDGSRLWEEIQPIDDFTFEIIKRAYIQRHVTELTPNKAIVTIHGIRTYADWNADVCHLASSRGWIVAPFIYGRVGPSIFTRKKRQNYILDSFREHLGDISHRYNASISVLSHSFGTYIVAKYLLGFDRPPVTFDTWVLTGAILNPNLDIDQFAGKVAVIINEIAPNDRVVDWATRAAIWRNNLVGNAGRVGFNSNSTRLEQTRSQVFLHNNMVRRDIVAQRWLPWLEANVGRSYDEAIELLKAKFS